LATLSVILTILAPSFSMSRASSCSYLETTIKRKLAGPQAPSLKLREALETGISVFDVLDYDSGESYACASLFSGNPLRPTVRNALRLSSRPDDLLLVERVVVHPHHCGHGIGLLSMQAWFNTVATPTTLVVCQPSPLADDGRPLLSDDPEFDLGLETLRRYWSKAGFIQVAGSDLFIASTESASRPVP